MPTRLCRVRHSLISDLPEERVRQRCINRLVKAGIPLSSLICEVDIRDLGIRGAHGRLDLAITKDDAPVVIFEFKAPSVPITERAILQGIAYANATGASMVFATNGKDHLGSKRTLRRRDSWKPLAILSMQDIVRTIAKGGRLEEPLVWNRHANDWLSDQRYHKELDAENIVGVDTPRQFLPFLANLDNRIMAGRFRKKMISGYVVSDIGVSYQYFGNASGGKFPGYYRSFLCAGEGVEFVMRLAMLGTNRTIQDPVYGNRRGRTILMMASEGQGMAPRALCEVSLDEGLRKIGAGVIAHTGRINLNNRPFRKADFLAQMAAIHPDIHIRDGFIVIHDETAVVERGSQNDDGVLTKILTYALAVKHIKDRAGIENRPMI